MGSKNKKTINKEIIISIVVLVVAIAIGIPLGKFLFEAMRG